MPNTHEHEMLTAEFVCVDPEVGEHYLHGYVAGTLAEEQLQAFKDHLVFCRQCQEEINYLQWAIEQLKIRVQQTLRTPHDVSGLLRQYADAPLPVTAMTDGNASDLIQDYYEIPLTERLAAAQVTAGELTFPFTIEYANGQVIGQFLKRTGQLFFRLKKSSIGQEQVACALVYTSGTDPSASQTFALHEGEDQRLGEFRQFVAAETIQGMLEALKQFQLVLKKQES